MVDDVRDECKDAFCLIGRHCSSGRVSKRRESCPVDFIVDESLGFSFIDELASILGDKNMHARLSERGNKVNVFCPAEA